MEKLLKPASYYASIRPENYSVNEEAQGEGSRKGRQGWAAAASLPHNSTARPEHEAISFDLNEIVRQESTFLVNTEI
jgi:hypothetical protein